MFEVKNNIIALIIFRVKKGTTEKMSLWSHATHCFSPSVVNVDHVIDQ